MTVYNACPVHARLASETVNIEYQDLRLNIDRYDQIRQHIGLEKIALMTYWSDEKSETE